MFNKDMFIDLADAYIAKEKRKENFNSSSPIFTGIFHREMMNKCLKYKPNELKDFSRFKKQLELWINEYMENLNDNKTDR